LKQIVFEDSLHPKLNVDGRVILDKSRYVVLSRMLTKCYDNRKDITINFLNSIGNAQKYLNEYINDDCTDRVIMFIDLPIDNEKSIRSFINIINIIVFSRLNNIVVVPIPCIEYCAINAFGDSTSEDFDIVHDLKLYKDTKTCKCNVNKYFVTFERYCKAVFSKIVPNVYNGNIYADRFDDVISLEACMKLLHELPTYYATEEENIECIKSDYEQESRSMFDKILNQGKLYKCYGVRNEALEVLDRAFVKLENLWNE
jgi:hypothetical protein